MDDSTARLQPPAPWSDLQALEIHIQAPRQGDPCPNCGEGVLDYDGLLNLGCTRCGFSLAGCFT